MKKFIQMTYGNGMTMQLPTSVVAQNRAAYYFNETKEFATLEDAQKDTEEYFSEDSEIGDWLFNNMNLSDYSNNLMPINFVPNEENDVSDITYTDEPKPVNFQPDSILEAPIGMLAAFCVQNGDSCSIVAMGESEDHPPSAAIVFLQGPLLHLYMTALATVTDSANNALAESKPAEPASPIIIQ